LALQKLGMFVMKDYLTSKENPAKKDKKIGDKPLVISVKNGKKGMTLVVAILNSGYQDSRNDFGQRFREAADKARVNSARHDSFETAMVEIKNEDWRQFIQALQEYD
jgi:hypothetical protein